MTLYESVTGWGVGTVGCMGIGIVMVCQKSGGESVKYIWWMWVS